MRPASVSVHGGGAGEGSLEGSKPLNRDDGKVGRSRKKERTSRAKDVEEEVRQRLVLTQTSLGPVRTM